MASKKRNAATNQKKQNQKRQQATAERSGNAVGMSPGVFGLGIVALIIAIGSSLMLSLEHLGGLALPGCGPDSGCARAAASVWGTVPGLGWPTAHVGLAYFLGLLAAWLFARRGVPTAMRIVVWIGAIGSVVLTIAMFAGNYVCMYCAVVHVANVVFLVAVELSSRHAARYGLTAEAPKPAASFAGAFVVATLVLAVAQVSTQAAVDRQAEADLDDSIQRLTSGQNGEGASNSGTTSIDDDDPAEQSEPFTGRYRLGPEKAAIRLVAFTDFQCPDCKRVEDEIMAIFNERDDMSVSVKHFPMAGACNPHISGRGPHPNACWAARAAEAAGILRGNDGFWTMHDWLFEVQGSFTDSSLPPALREMGYDTQEFISTMMSERTERLVQEDIEQAIDLGIFYTPMVFINGVEIKGFGVFANNAIRRAVEALAATNPEPRTAAADNPPPAIKKYIDDWKVQRQRSLPPDSVPHTRGADDPLVEVVVWGDYQEPNTAVLDTRIRALLDSLDGVQYHFRHYPINQSCNPSATVTKHDNACRMAKAAEAAAEVGGEDAYWEMHAWLLRNQDDFTQALLMQQLPRMEFDPRAFTTAMNSAAVANAISEDASAAKRMGLRSIPFFWVNGQRVPRWKLEGERVPERIIEIALEEARNAN